MIRALVVDDEAPARAKLRALLARESDVEVVGEAADGAAAVETIRAAAPDVVFLDVQMPRLDGFGVVEAVGVEAMPLVVFVTAYDEHALRAFEVHALDYLLKPYAPTRFRRVLDRVRAQLARRPAEGDLAGRIDRLLSAVRPAPRYPRQLLVERAAPGRAAGEAREDEERQVLLAVESIERVEAERNVLHFFTRDGEYLRRDTLTALEERLDPERFLRINRSEIVRLDAVREVQPWFHGDARVVLRDGTVRPLSRRYRGRLKERF